MRLQRFERRLESAISGAFAKVFRSAVQPVEISAALQRECDNNAQVLSRNRRLVPNVFHVELSAGDLERLTPFDNTLSRELTATLREHALAQSYVFPGPVSIDFDASDELTTGRFRISSAAQAKVTTNVADHQPPKATAYVEVNGERHPLTPPKMTVGRGTAADLQINDPGISRQHIEFRITYGNKYGDPAAAGDINVSVHDLGSTNGMLVDGSKTTTGHLYDGSKVKIGNTVLKVVMHHEEARGV